MYLTKEEIKQLKSDLMFRRSKSTSASTNTKNNNNNSESIARIVMKEVRKVRNGEIGITFEENIRKALEIEYKWKIPYIWRHFFYRDISFKGKTYSLAPFERLNFKDFSIILDSETNDCLFKYKGKDKDKKMVKVNEANSVSRVNFAKIKFEVSPPKEVELDGVYHKFDYDELPFNEDEVMILFDNTPEKKYEYAIVEIKLSAQKLVELIVQLKKDQAVMNKFIEKSKIYLGFVNINKSDSELINNFDFDATCGQFQCILFGIKNGTFCERNITLPIDWKIVSQLYHFENEINTKLEGVKGEMKKEFGELRALIEGIEEKID